MPLLTQYKCTCPDGHPAAIQSDTASGTSFCAECGTVLEENEIVAEVTFVEGGNGGSMALGRRINADNANRHVGPGFGRGMGGRNPVADARQTISQYAYALGVGREAVIEMAHRIYNLAYLQNLTKGKRKAQVCAVCLYIALRKEQAPVMLIELADLVQTSIFRLGTLFQLFRREFPAVARVEDIDPSIYIHRFATMLEFGDRTLAVANDALLLVKRMKLDWIADGRRPAGICGTALLIAARMHHFHRTIKEIVHIVKMSDTTVKQRLREFQSTAAAMLSVAQFREKFDSNDVEAFLPPSFVKHRVDEIRGAGGKVVVDRPDVTVPESAKKKKTAAAAAATDSDEEVLEKDSSDDDDEMQPDSDSDDEEETVAATIATTRRRAAKAKATAKPASQQQRQVLTPPATQQQQPPRPRARKTTRRSAMFVTSSDDEDSDKEAAAADESDSENEAIGAAAASRKKAAKAKKQRKPAAATRTRKRTVVDSDEDNDEAEKKDGATGSEEEDEEDDYEAELGRNIERLSRKLLSSTAASEANSKKKRKPAAAAEGDDDDEAETASTSAKPKPKARRKRARAREPASEAAEPEVDPIPLSSIISELSRNLPKNSSTQGTFTEVHAGAIKKPSELDPLSEILPMSKLIAQAQADAAAAAAAGGEGEEGEAMALDPEDEEDDEEAVMAIDEDDDDEEGIEAPFPTPAATGQLPPPPSLKLTPAAVAGLELVTDLGVAPPDPDRGRVTLTEADMRLSDLDDDDDVKNAMVPLDQVEARTHVWHSLNYDWMQAQAEKQRRAEAALAAGGAAGKPRRKRKARADGAGGGGGSGAGGHDFGSAAEAVHSMAQQRISTKVNQSQLAELFDFDSMLKGAGAGAGARAMLPNDEDSGGAVAGGANGAGGPYDDWYGDEYDEEPYAAGGAGAGLEHDDDYGADGGAQFSDGEAEV
ncbi:transcription factor TFIIIB subunit brf1 [Blastocladiella emersonii ATCC 22665]|nr:transcription factor TFIIIB subunit brf1 [Blastocladiella emersonii ATCC 22665]